MSSCPPMTFSGISPEKFAALLINAQSQGLQILSESGSTTYQGLDFTWNYDPTTESLNLHCTQKPIFVPCSMIESKIRNVLG